MLLGGKDKPDPAFLEAVVRASGQKTLAHCYQCGKCTAGCPTTFAMDYKPNQIIRMLQLGRKEEVLGSRTIWVCTACFTCSTRCPCNIDVAQVMDSLRVIARREGKTRLGKDVVLFNDLFLLSVRRNGRVFESGLVLSFNLRRKTFFRDAELGKFMFARGKLRFTPDRPRGVRELARLFARAEERVEE
ncbi:MAG: 4Fe-4S dicluster domain-containing protein [Bacillota bacterium]